MGSHYSFSCPGCGYEAEVSGGEDYGYRLRTDTRVCPVCKVLVDVITKPGSPDQTEDVGKCLKCKTDKVVTWDTEKRPCPKCGKMMKKGELTAYWD